MAAGARCPRATRLLVIIAAAALLSVSVAAADESQPQCSTYRDCSDRQTCYEGRCMCYGLWGTVGEPDCRKRTWATYWVVVHAVVVALLYRKAAGLHWLSLMDHIRQSKAAHSRGKQGGGCGWIRGLLCLKVAFNVTSLLAYVSMLLQRVFFVTYAFSLLSVHKYRESTHGPTFILTRAWLGCLALSLLSFSWIWSTVAQRPQLHLSESGRDLEAKRRFGGLLGCYWYRCPCSAAVRQLVFVMLLMQVVGWTAVMRLSSSTVFMQTLSGLSIELMAVLYFLFGSYNVLGSRVFLAMLLPCCFHRLLRQHNSRLLGPTPSNSSRHNSSTKGPAQRPASPRLQQQEEGGHDSHGSSSPKGEGKQTNAPGPDTAPWPGDVDGGCNNAPVEAMTSFPTHEEMAAKAAKWAHKVKREEQAAALLVQDLEEASCQIMTIPSLQRTRTFGRIAPDAAELEDVTDSTEGVQGPDSAPLGRPAARSPAPDRSSPPLLVEEGGHPAGADLPAPALTDEQRANAAAEIGQQNTTLPVSTWTVSSSGGEPPSLEDRMSRVFHHVVLVARTWIYFFSLSCVFLLIYGMTEGIPRYGVISSTAFCYTMCCELIANLYCLRYVSRPVRPYLRSFCGDFESVGDEDKRRRAIVRLMRIEKLETAPEALLRKK